MSTMLAAVVHAAGDFRVEQIPMPLCPSGGMLLKVHACGLCGSDLRTLRNGHHRVKLPFTVGHEFSGTVQETGSEYRGPWKIGEMLAVGPLVYCGTCDFCVSGRFELCSSYREIAQAWQGGFAQYVAIPAEAVRLGTILKVPEGLDPAIAAVAEPISSCVNAQEKGAVGLGDTVVIIGAGPIGCVHVSLARARGAQTVILADVSADRLELSKPFGPDYRIDASSCNLVERIRELTGGKGASVVITANPVAQTQVQAIEMAAKGGRVLLFGGLPPEQSCPGVNTNLIHYNALSVMGTTIFSPAHFRTAMDLLARERIPHNALVTHRFPLSEFVKGANLALEGKVIKAVFLP